MCIKKANIFSFLKKKSKGRITFQGIKIFYNVIAIKIVWNFPGKWSILYFRIESPETIVHIWESKD